jgi:hypothetical protein
MGILNDLLKRVQTVNDSLITGSVIRDVVTRHADDILDLQREQLFEGKASDGEDIRPYYSEDLKPTGWFHSVETARRYAAWKLNKINYPYTANRNPDAPNLYINGRFHDELGVQFGPDAVAVVGSTNYAREIVAKYGLHTFGLMSSKWMVLFQQRGGYFELMNEIKRMVYV